MPHIDPQTFAISMFVLMISVTIHELAHAKSAESCGDDTARRAGRISLNPLDHLDPVGTIMMVITSIAGRGFGWAKPVPVNPMNFRHPRWDNLKVSIWGPGSNLIMAAFFGLVFRLFAPHLPLIPALIVLRFVELNIVLAVFNMVPIAPLDGSHIMSSLLPTEQARNYDRFMGQYGFLMLIALVVMMPSVLSTILGPPVDLLFRLLTGLPV